MKMKANENIKVPFDFTLVKKKIFSRGTEFGTLLDFGGFTVYKLSQHKRSALTVIKMTFVNIFWHFWFHDIKLKQKQIF